MKFLRKILAWFRNPTPLGSAVLESGPDCEAVAEQAVDQAHADGRAAATREIATRLLIAMDPDAGRPDLQAAADSDEIIADACEALEDWERLVRTVATVRAALRALPGLDLSASGSSDLVVLTAQVAQRYRDMFTRLSAFPAAPKTPTESGRRLASGNRVKRVAKKRAKSSR